jgi:arginine deiminase
MPTIPSIYNETDPLDEVLVWGEPGIETLLGQLLPKTRSLFHSYYDVLEARREFWHMQGMIQASGAAVTRAKDAFVAATARYAYPSMPENVKALRHALVERADAFYRFYGAHKARELAAEGAETTIESLHRAVLSEMNTILDEDIARYGPEAAIRLNALLSLERPSPMANIFYGRDQSQVVADKVVISSLRWEIRRPESKIYRLALEELGYSGRIVEIGDGFLEGGDLVMFNNTCYVGVGARTTLAAVKDLYRKLSDTFQRENIRLLAVSNERHVEESNFFLSPVTEHQQLMHLDMFFIPLRRDLAMAYTDELDQRKVAQIVERNGRVVAEPLGDFRAHLAAEGVSVLEVDAAEQANFATNLLHLGGDRLLAALSRNPRVNAELAERGFNVQFAEINRLVGGFGAVHCMTAPVKRQTADKGPRTKDGE